MTTLNFWSAASVAALDGGRRQSKAVTYTALQNGNRRLGIALALAVILAPVWFGLAAQESAGFKTQHFNGKVVGLSTVLAKAGVKLDADAAPQWLALVTDDGTVYPLIKDAGTRMFFQDPVLLDRPMRLTGRLVPKTSLLQAVNVHSYRQGKLHEVYYWCDICTIKGYEKVKCGCCGAPMELREVAVK
jgi:hypothetical protein